MPLPLAIPVAIGAYELAALAAASVAALWLASPQGREATSAAAEALSDAISKPRAAPIPLSPSIPRTCPQSKCDCGAILQRIVSVMTELRRRIAEMEVDEYGLFGIRPDKIPGIGSWPGHIQQFRNKQAQLRRLLNEATTMGCPIPLGAWQLATRNPPNRPHQ